jgi:uncharacterized membrane protein
MEKIASCFAMISTGLLAGAFAYTFFAVLPTFYEVPLAVHLAYRAALMRHNGIYVQGLMALSIITPLWWSFTIRGSGSLRVLAVLASLCSLTSFLVTRFGNVPINQLIRNWPPSSPPPGYQDLLQRWTTFHNIRCTTAAAAFVLVVLAQTGFHRSSQ